MTSEESEPREGEEDRVAHQIGCLQEGVVIDDITVLAPRILNQVIPELDRVLERLVMGMIPREVMEVSIKRKR
jgi:hypothetical protein